jgi:LPXTG-motif cell wall-anchored protein
MDPLPYLLGITAIIIAIVGLAVFFTKFRKKKTTN